MLLFVYFEGLRRYFKISFITFSYVYEIFCAYQKPSLSREGLAVYTEGRIFHCELWKHFYRHALVHLQAYSVYQK
jgi:hypothetical protein